MVSLWGFGFSTNYIAALLSRALPALFVASPVALKSMIGDVCDQTGQAKAMAGELYLCDRGPPAEPPCVNLHDQTVQFGRVWEGFV